MRSTRIAVVMFAAVLPDLRHAGPAQRVAAVTHCRGRFEVTLADGARRALLEYDLSFKIDSSDRGPTGGAPALIPVGRVGDRAIVVVASVDELGRTLRRAPDCPEGVK